LIPIMIRVLLTPGAISTCSKCTSAVAPPPIFFGAQRLRLVDLRHLGERIGIGLAAAADDDLRSLRGAAIAGGIGRLEPGEIEIDRIDLHGRRRRGGGGLDAQQQEQPHLTLHGGPRLHPSEIGRS
jgi:hypothetical protein